MSATTVSDLGNEAKNRGCNFGAIWDACCGPVYRVVDEEGANVSDAKIRHLEGSHWLYVDDDGGYEVMHERAASRLILTPTDDE